MTLKTLLTACALMAAPALAYASGCNWTDTAHHCGPGQIFDESKGMCVEQPTG